MYSKRPIQGSAGLQIAAAAAGAATLLWFVVSAGIPVTAHAPTAVAAPDRVIVVADNCTDATAAVRDPQHLSGRPLEGGEDS